MTDLPALLDPGTDHTATTCLACGATRQIGHLPICPASHPDATDLLVETLSTGHPPHLADLRPEAQPHPGPPPPVRRADPATALGPARRQAEPAVLRRRAGQRDRAADGHRPTGWPRSGTAPGAACPSRTAAAPTCGAAAATSTPTRSATPTRTCGREYSLLGFKVRYQTSWSLMWLLDTGLAAVWVAEDLTTTAPAPTPITRRCYLDWCDTCPGQARAAPDAEPAPCACPCHHEGDPR